VRDFRPRLCFRVHFYNGWQFFLSLLCPLHFGYDRRCQRFSRFPDANTNSNCDAHGCSHANSDSNGYSHANDNSNCDGYAKCDSHRNVDAKCDANSNCNAGRFTIPRYSTYANSAASPDTSASPRRIVDFP
jgi:hypothetical protein